ncbi:mammalian cell entry protein [Mycolicibacterium pulveris]|nr:mammalian cell entry protein [Mycolicibacterium pulveris]MCV6981107.1 mammalian cell entry protein [Mycolicibacterium pulveris]
MRRRSMYRAGPLGSGPHPQARALAFGLGLLAALTALFCWFGVQDFEIAREHKQRDRFLAAGRDGVLRLTTISDTDVEAKVEQILDTSTGEFHEDFQQRSAWFIDTVKRSKSKTVGTVLEVGLETVDTDRAEVLVAVSVKTSLTGTQAPARLWRMRISLQDVNGEAKVSDVEFIP